MLSAVLHPDRSRPWIERDGETQDDLVVHARRIAALLRPAGAAPDGRRIVLSCRHARSFVPGLLGAWLAGAEVELLPNIQPGTLDRVDADPGVAHVLHDVAERQARSVKAIYLPDVPSAGAPAPAEPAAWPAIAVSMTTSGTTEQPRRVGKSMAQLIGEVDVLIRLVPGARCVLSTVPLSHFYGLLFAVLLPLRSGARLVSHDALLPADLAALLEREAADLMISTPAHLRAMAAAAMPRGLRVISSGARMPAELQLRLAAELGWQVTDVLGSTETGGIATRQHPMTPWTPFPGATVSAPDGQLAVASAWCDGGAARLDDRIELLRDGRFHFLGRNIELVKIAGKRAHAEALEAAALAVPGVTDAAVVVHGAPGREPRVAIALCVAEPGAGAAAGAGAGAAVLAGVRAAIRRDFDAVFVPRIVRIVPRIPRTERGKLDREALRSALGLAGGATVDRVALRRVAPGAYAAHIPADLVFFRGHFDALAVLPGAVLVERVVWPAVTTEWPEVRALRGIRRLRFCRPVFPDQQLAIAVQRDPDRVTFEVSCGAQPVASGQLIVA